MSKEPQVPDTSADEGLARPSYPALEEFIATASKEDIRALFTQVRSELSKLKGPRAEHAKKVEVSLEKTEELLGRLLEIRTQLEHQAKGAK